jgi:hypothetical protein
LRSKVLPAWSRVRFVIPGAWPMGCAQTDTAIPQLNARAKSGIKPRHALDED